MLHFSNTHLQCVQLELQSSTTFLFDEGRWRKLRNNNQFQDYGVMRRTKTPLTGPITVAKKQCLNVISLNSIALCLTFVSQNVSIYMYRPVSVFVHLFICMKPPPIWPQEGNIFRFFYSFLDFIDF